MTLTTPTEALALNASVLQTNTIMTSIYNNMLIERATTVYENPFIGPAISNNPLSFPPFDMYGGSTGYKYASICVLGLMTGIPAPTNTPVPYLCLQFSNDTYNWYGDGQYPNLLATGTANEYTFTMLATNVATRYVRLWCINTFSALERVEINLQTRN